MTLYSIHQSQRLPISLQEAWNYFADPSNLEQITPEWLRFDIKNEAADSMYPGMIISYRITALAGIPTSWVTEITQVHSQQYFIDEQRFGPYKFWHHQHHFRAIEEGVEVEDLVHYALPFGVLGRVVHRLDIRSRLESIFDYRRQVLEKKFGSV
jgi:ligand-binding SRPBCC domain-containing protein